MATKNETLTLCCDKCGADKVITPGELDDSSVIVCDVCGVPHGTWGGVKEEFLKLLTKSAQGSFGEAFDDSEGPKFIKSDI